MIWRDLFEKGASAGMGFDIPTRHELSQAFFSPPLASKARHCVRATALDFWHFHDIQFKPAAPPVIEEADLWCYSAFCFSFFFFLFALHSILSPCCTSTPHKPVEQGFDGSTSVRCDTNTLPSKVTATLNDLRLLRRPPRLSSCPSSAASVTGDGVDSVSRPALPTDVALDQVDAVLPLPLPPPLLQ